MNIEIQISIIIPTYNRKENVCNLVDSLLLQINKNFEIIIVDDGSTDNTYDALRVYSNHNNISLPFFLLFYLNFEPYNDNVLSNVQNSREMSLEDPHSSVKILM